MLSEIGTSFIITYVNCLSSNEISPNQGLRVKKFGVLPGLTAIVGRGIYLLMNSFYLSLSQLYESSLLLISAVLCDKNAATHFHLFVVYI